MSLEVGLIRSYIGTGSIIDIIHSIKHLLGKTTVKQTPPGRRLLLMLSVKKF